MGFSSKVLVDQDKTQTTKSHNEHFSTFTNESEWNIQNDLRQMNQIITAMLSMTGRITMLGLSRWAGEGGSYRTIQRFTIRSFRGRK